MLDIHSREVDPLNAGDGGLLRQREGQIARAAPDIQHVPSAYAGEVDEKRRQPSAPAPHLALVASTVGRNKGGRSLHSHRSPPSSAPSSGKVSPWRGP